MIIVNLNKVTKLYGAQLVVDEISWEIQEGQRIGLVGPNGAGKSTLFKIIAGLEPVDGGTVYRHPNISIGYLAQEPRLDPGKTVFEEAMQASAEVQHLDAELRRLEEKMGDPAVYDNARKLTRVMEAHERSLEAFEEAGGMGYRSRVEGTLKGLSFETQDFDQPTSNLSGGQKKLVGLAKLLVTQPDLLLLDEPDNHLDLEGKTFLEKLIVDYPGTVVIVSHDRYLLDIVAESIADVEEGTVRVYQGNYSEYAYEKRRQLMLQQKRYEIQQREIRRLKQSIQRLLGWGAGQNEKFVSRAQSMQKRLERMDRVEKPTLERRTMGLELQGERGSDKVLEIRQLTKCFDEEPLFQDLNILIWNGQRVGLVGPNGVGKSVLFRMIVGYEEVTDGEIKIGPSIDLAYYAQEHETLNLDWTPLQEVRWMKPMYERQAYNFLGRFLFDHDMAQKEVRELSGGEKSRLQMAKLMLSEANFLLLDEPTNNLDIPSIEVLEDELETFAGTVFVTSHDRYFLDNIVDRMLELEDGELTEYLGDYTYYREKKEAQ